MKLAVFDVDGVIIDTKFGSFKDLGIALGKEQEVKKHDEEYQKRKHLGPWGLEELAEIFKGIGESEIKKASEKIVENQLMYGFEEAAKELKKRNYKIASYSSSPFWIMELLAKKFGFIDFCGNVIEVKNGKITGRLIEKVDRYIKAERLKKFVDKNKISRKYIYIIGDSVTDLPMAQYGCFIAFNSDKKEVREKADYIIDKKDLREILQYIR